MRLTVLACGVAAFISGWAMFNEATLEKLYARLRARDSLDLAQGVEQALRNDLELNPAFQGRSMPGARAASVLMPLVDREEGISVLLTERTEHLPDHAGQVSFPGGSREAHDSDAVDTALRETEEEVGIARSFVDVIGTLDLYPTGTGFEITPVVGVVSGNFSLTIDATEVAEVFEVPLSFILDAGNREVQTRAFNGADFTYYAFPYEGHYIWGATAGMLVNLAAVLTVHARAGE